MGALGNHIQPTVTHSERFVEFLLAAKCHHRQIEILTTTLISHLKYRVTIVVLHGPITILDFGEKRIVGYLSANVHIGIIIVGKSLTVELRLVNLTEDSERFDIHAGIGALAGHQRTISASLSAKSEAIGKTDTHLSIVKGRIVLKWLVEIE